MTNADNADDLLHLTNTAVRAEFLRHSLWQITEGISLYVNANKNLNLKSVDEFIYFGSNISSTEIDVNIQLAKT